MNIQLQGSHKVQLVIILKRICKDVFLKDPFIYSGKFSDITREYFQICVCILILDFSDPQIA